MVNISENIINSEFKSDDNKKLNLSLLIGPDRLTYLSYNEKTTDFFEIKSLSFKSKNDLKILVGDIMNDFPNYHNVKIFQIPKHCSISKYNFEYQIETIFDTDIYFKIDNEIVPFTEKIENILSINLKQFISENNKDLSVYSYWLQGKFFIALIQGKTLIDIETYSYKSAEDALYFTILFYDKHKLKSLEIPIFISGQLYENSKIYKLLFFYIRHIYFCTKAEKYNHLNCFENQPTHLHWDILNTIG